MHPNTLQVKSCTSHSAKGDNLSQTKTGSKSFEERPAAAGRLLQASAAMSGSGRDAAHAKAVDHTGAFLHSACLGFTGVSSPN